MEKFILVLDQGTTNSRAMIFDNTGHTVSFAQDQVHPAYPHPGEVEQDPYELWSTQLTVAQRALTRARIPLSQIAGIGITNQRETTILWDKTTGQPLYNAISWQCRRTADLCTKLKESGWASIIQHKTGLIVDPYFSGTKIQWILNHVTGARDLAKKGHALFGTVDTWLLWKLSGGKLHLTDYTNASRTMLFNIQTLQWDPELLDLLQIPASLLPEVHASSDYYGTTDSKVFGHAVPITGVAGDQQAALFGQACFYPGMAKTTYGTGCFVLLNIGDRLSFSSGLITTLAATSSPKAEYVLEGSIFNAGAAVQWLKDGLQLIDHVDNCEQYATQVSSNAGVYLVPAYSGLGAPHWDPTARGLIIGITRGTTKQHIVRATLEAIAYQVADVVRCMELNAKQSILELRVDGGASINNFLMQFQADILGRPVIRPRNSETTALGAAFLAGLAADVWASHHDLESLWAPAHYFAPQMISQVRQRMLHQWTEAVTRAKGWTLGEAQDS
jgi:glycerol kinase